MLLAHPGAQADADTRSRILSDALYLTFLARYGETAWPIPHPTSRTDIPLIAQDEAEACRLRGPEYWETAGR